MQASPLKFKNAPTELFVTVVNLNTHRLSNLLVPVNLTNEFHLMASVKLAEDKSLDLAFVPDEFEHNGRGYYWPMQDEPQTLEIGCAPTMPPTCIGFALKEQEGKTYCLGLVPHRNVYAYIDVNDVLYQVNQTLDLDKVEADHRDACKGTESNPEGMTPIPWFSRLMAVKGELWKNFDIITVDFPRTPTFNDLPSRVQMKVHPAGFLFHLMKPFVPGLDKVLA